jgi:hypothetical protein
LHNYCWDDLANSELINVKFGRDAVLLSHEKIVNKPARHSPHQSITAGKTNLVKSCRIISVVRHRFVPLTPRLAA